MFKYLYGILFVLFLLTGCSTSSEFTGFSYDPPDVTNTRDKTIYPQKKRVIGAGTPKVWVSNEFEGARMNDFFKSGPDSFTVVIEPENAPINRSPWYAFDMYSDSVRTITLAIRYRSGSHRYIPKIKTFKDTKIRTDFSIDSTGTAYIALNVGPEPVRVSAHFTEGIQFSDLMEEQANYAKRGFITDTAGYSHQGLPVLLLHNQGPQAATGRPALILMSRQHPPEVSGYRVFQHFFDRITSGDPLSDAFLDRFTVFAFPMVNPDGVVQGHWRHNAGGVDLNRDWSNFNQPETRAVRSTLLELTSTFDSRVVYGIDFHSTNENIFYPILKEVKTDPDDISQEWYTQLDSLNADLKFSSEAFDTSSPIAKNWIYHTFGSDALTFEVDDELSDEQIQRLGETAATSLMKLLLERTTE